MYICTHGHRNIHAHNAHTNSHQERKNTCLYIMVCSSEMSQWPVTEELCLCVTHVTCVYPMYDPCSGWWHPLTFLNLAVLYKPVNNATQHPELPWFEGALGCLPFNSARKEKCVLEWWRPYFWSHRTHYAKCRSWFWTWPCVVERERERKRERGSEKYTKGRRSNKEVLSSYPLHGKWMPFLMVETDPHSVAGNKFLCRPSRLLSSLTSWHHSHPCTWFALMLVFCVYVWVGLAGRCTCVRGPVEPGPGAVWLL